MRRHIASWRDAPPPLPSLFFLCFRLLLFHPHERNAELKLPSLVDAGLFINPLAVCIYGAGGTADLLRTLAGTQAADKSLAYFQLLGAQLGIAL